MNGLDLFSGIGGLTRALGRWVSPVAYCELDAYCRGVLLSRMWDREIPTAPIWDDVRTLRGESLPRRVDIIYGGFPCQDISVAGRGAGLDGKRSGLFFEIERLIGEVRPSFVFLENVPAIRTRGADVVAAKLARLGYDCRWDVVSAAEVGAPHLRKRWFLLAHSNSTKRGVQPEPRWAAAAIVSNDGQRREVARDVAAAQGDAPSPHPHSLGSHPSAPDHAGQSLEVQPPHEQIRDAKQVGGDVPDAQGVGREQRGPESILPRQIGRITRSGVGQADAEKSGLQRSLLHGLEASKGDAPDSSWWSTEPNVGRVAHGVPKRVDRLRALGNAVVPLQARTAFKRLSGLE